MDWIAFVSFVIVAAWTPGPNNIISMSHAGKYGYRKTLSFLFGVSAGFFVDLLITGLFNYWLYETIPKVKLFLSIIGFSYMVYLALMILKGSSEEENNKEERIVSLKTGILFQFINPKAVLAAITITGNFIIPYFDSVFSLVFISVFLSFIAFLATSTWALMGTILNNFLKKHEKIFGITMAILLIFSAVSIII